MKIASLTFSFFIALQSHAQQPATAAAHLNENAVTDHAVPVEPPEKRSLVLIPALNIALPGLGELIDGEYSRAAAYFGLALTSVSLYSKADSDILNMYYMDGFDPHRYRDVVDTRWIANSLGSISMISVYDTFSRRVPTYQADGGYAFLPRAAGDGSDQRIQKILKAPFQFHYLQRWTTWVPFLVAIGGGLSNYNESPRPRHFALRPIDIGGSAMASYGAGTGEEAIFRGWMLPVLYENTDTFWLANGLQGLAFGFAHGSRAYFQTAAGFYLGWLARRNDWDLQESVFVHAWWDVFLLTAEAIRARGFAEDFSVQFPMYQQSF